MPNDLAYVNAMRIHAMEILLRHAQGKLRDGEYVIPLPNALHVAWTDNNGRNWVVNIYDNDLHPVCVD